MKRLKILINFFQKVWWVAFYMAKDLSPILFCTSVLAAIAPVHYIFRWLGWQTISGSNTTTLTFISFWLITTMAFDLVLASIITLMSECLSGKYPNWKIIKK